MTESPNPFADYADRFRRREHARREEEIHQPPRRAGFGETLRVLAGPSLVTLCGVTALCVVLGGLSWLGPEVGPGDEMGLWGVLAGAGGLGVAAFPFKGFARAMGGRRLNPLGLFLAWVGQAVAWTVLSVVLGAVLVPLLGGSRGGPEGLGWFLAAPLVLAYVLVVTLGLWSLTRTWEWSPFVAVPLVVVGAFGWLAALMALAFTVTGSVGWWSTVLLALGMLSLPGLLWLAHRPMDHVAVAGEAAFDGPFGF